MKHARYSALALLLLVACHGSPTEPGGTLPFTTIAKEQYTGLSAARQEAISTQERWNAVWAEIVSTRTPKEAVPAVNFMTSQVLLVARGQTPDSCRTIEIERVEQQNDTYRVSVQDARKPMSCSCPGVVVQPIHAVVVARVATEMTTQFRSVTIGSACN